MDSSRAGEEPLALESFSAIRGCPVDMGFDLPCGRPLHDAPPGVDEVPVCLMHSKDPATQEGSLFDQFWIEADGIMERAGSGEAYFRRFVFPRLDLQETEITPICHFDWAVFTQYADFSATTFAQTVSFRKATFARKADFSRAVFRQGVSFAESTFLENANFHSAAFHREAQFSGVSCVQDAYFDDAAFADRADFTRAKFAQRVSFGQARFADSAHFWEVSFLQEADFWKTTFAAAADFGDSTFADIAYFPSTSFHDVADWRGCRFLDKAAFRGTLFHAENPAQTQDPTAQDPNVQDPHTHDPHTHNLTQPSALFSFATFANPGEVVFDDVDLSRVFFHNCDVSGVWFTSSARWAESSGRQAVILEETIPLHDGYGKQLQRDGERDYRAIAQIYQQLKKNYDARLDYWTANEFHYGEMEMKRLAAPTAGPLLPLRRWWHRRLGLVALYRSASDYGNSYRKPMLWLVAILVLFALLFPLPQAGVQRNGRVATWPSTWQPQNGARHNLAAEARLFGNSLLASIDTAMFQKAPEYAPAYPWGRVLAIAEVSLTSTLFALFLLAIRRQFRR